MKSEVSKGNEEAYDPSNPVRDEELVEHITDLDVTVDEREVQA